jgi:predicted transcriptional regulator
MVSKTREITIINKSGAIGALIKRFSKKEVSYDFESLSTLRKLLSNEKMRVLYAIKTEKPSSMYALAKLLKRDFKSISGDIKLLEKFGFIDLIYEKSHGRACLKPIVVVDSMNLEVKL